jgi:hypothetical protein
MRDSGYGFKICAERAKDAQNLYAMRNHLSSNMHGGTHVACQEEVAERDARRARDLKAIYFSASQLQ